MGSNPTRRVYFSGAGPGGPVGFTARDAGSSPAIAPKSYLPKGLSAEGQADGEPQKKGGEI